MGEFGTVSVGIDLVDVARIANLVERYGDVFIEKTFCDFEIEYCKKFSVPSIHFAARFAAKEAIVKALRTGFTDKISFKSVGVKNLENGAPEAFLDEAAREKLSELGADKILISLTHLKDYAQAIAIAVK